MWGPAAAACAYHYAPLNLVFTTSPSHFQLQKRFFHQVVFIPLRTLMALLIYLVFFPRAAFISRDVKGKYGHFVCSFWSRKTNTGPLGARGSFSLFILPRLNSRKEMIRQGFKKAWLPPK